MKRVLIITYYWPPSGGSGVQRWVKFSKYLPKNGWQPVIYTPENPDVPTHDESLLKDIAEDTEIIKRPILEPYSLYRKIMGRNSSVQMANLAGTGIKQSFKDKLSLFLRGNLFIPDPRVWWVQPSIRFLLKYLKEHPVDAIISTGPPHSVHLIALELSKRLHLPWMVDFRDPWTGMYYFNNLRLTECSKRKYHRQEQSVIDGASVVLTCTPAVREDFRKRTRTPVEMVTNGFDAEDYNITPESDGFFNLTQTGQMGADGNPVVLWRVLGGLCKTEPGMREKLRIRLIGTIDREVLETIKEYGLEENLVLRGYLTHPDAVKEQLSAELLLIPLRKNPEMAKILPGKIFEYLAARRPVLGFGQEDGVMAGLIRESECGRMCDWENETGVREAVLEAWERYKSGKFEFTAKGYEKYSREALAERIAGILENMKYE